MWSELPTPLKKRRLCPLDTCVSESSTPYASPCATPTRAEPSDAPLTPQLLNTPPEPSTPTHTSQTPAHTSLQEVNTCIPGNSLITCSTFVLLTSEIKAFHTENENNSFNDFCVYRASRRLTALQRLAEDPARRRSA